MSAGANPDIKHSVVKQFAMFSDKYTGEKLTPASIQRIHRAEVLALCKSGTYMGIWQIAALANVLNTDVESVYPNYGGKTVRNDLNRIFHPFSGNPDGNATVHILWSSTRGTDIPEREWRPNHFVPLLRTYADSGNTGDDISSITDFEDSPNNTIDIAAIIQSLEEISEEQMDEGDVGVSDDGLSSEVLLPINLLQDLPFTLDANSDELLDAQLSSPSVTLAPASISCSTTDMKPGEVTCPALVTLAPASFSCSTTDMKPGEVTCPASVTLAPASISCSTTDDVKSGEVSGSASVTLAPASICSTTDDVKSGEVSSPASLTLAPAGISCSTTDDVKPDTVLSHKTGDYISVGHGTEVLPAVVIKWPFVNFFKKQKKGWVISETKHTLIESDVRAKLTEPDIILVSGTRLYYQFQDL